MSATAMDTSRILSLLSSMYLCKPSKDMVERWQLLLNADASPFMDELRSAVNGIDVEAAHELEDLLWEYTRLFVGPYKLPCPPWESVYTSPRRLMMQEAASQVQEIYRAAGLTVGSADIMPDHIGAELNFLSVLFQRMTSKTGHGYGEFAENFLNEHLGKWVPEFTHDMEEAADKPFYKALARATGNLITLISDGRVLETS